MKIRNIRRVAAWLSSSRVALLHRRRHYLLLTAAILVVTQSYHAPTETVTHSLTLVGPIRTVPESLFGLNIIAMNRWKVWPRFPFRTWRTFHFNWFDVEPQNGQWNFVQSDYETALSEEHGVELLPILEGVPAWADRSDDSALRQTNLILQARRRSMPIDQKAYEEYVRKIANRYKGRIHAYELWNEPVGVPAFDKDISSLINLNNIAYKTLKQVDPSVVVVSSAYSSGDPYPERPISKLDAFAKAGGFKNCDVIAFHFYVIPRRGESTPVPPEEILKVEEQVRRVLSKYGVNKPIWATELGWPNLNDDQNPVAPPKGMGRPLTPAMAAAWLARAYILGWASGIERIYWFAWEHDYFGLTEKNGDPKAPEIAYQTVEGWLINSVVERCERDPDAIWSCIVRTQGGVRNHILWSENGATGYHIPAYWKVTSVHDLYGGMSRPKSRFLKLGESPVMLISPN